MENNSLEVILLEEFDHKLIPLEIECYSYFANVLLTEEEASERIDDYIYSKKIYAFVLYSGSSCVGYTVLEQKSNKEVKSLFAYIQNDLRGNGYGSFLIKKTYEKLSEMGNKTVFGCITWKNEVSKRMVERHNAIVDEFSNEKMPSHYEVSLV